MPAVRERSVPEELLFPKEIDSCLAHHGEASPVLLFTFVFGDKDMEMKRD